MGNAALRTGAQVEVSRMTRPVMILAKGRQPGQAATLLGLVEEASG